MSQQSIFSVPFFHFKVSEWNKKKTDLENIMQKEQLDFLDNVKTSWKIEKVGKIREVERVLSDEINKVNSSLKINLEIQQVWFQDYETGMDHAAHVHGALGFSSIVYIKYDKTHPSTVFISPYLSSITGDHVKFSPDVEEGDIVFFPSNILHYVNRNQSDQNRIICSFNLRVKNESNRKFYK